ncbi:hypothetical protein Y1Q_0003883 [Alligator mississippiensis]|uniref:Uncharacterized protein n=1 Tax=Alligator mississippiensis TaxID=8496 RepID=A0A151MNM5_ALLMI|nr:hypothetical protein Y1Q_0003883 [Alligator mississippiensis]
MPQTCLIFAVQGLNFRGRWNSSQLKSPQKKQKLVFEETCWSSDRYNRPSSDKLRIFPQEKKKRQKQVPSQEARKAYYPGLPLPWWLSLP